jgi:hypothetical protein
MLYRCELMAKSIAFLATACLLCLLLAAVVYFSYFDRRRNHASWDSQAVVEEVRRLNELATVKYSIEKVVGMKEEKSPVGTESILLLVRGTVLAGINLSEVSPNDVSVASDGMARIRLSAPHIQAAYLDEKYTKVWDRSITWWTPWVTPDLDLEHKARLQAVDDIRKEALAMGIFADAERNAEIDIRAILEAFGVRKAVFVYGT